jgi:hypothetical protein
MTKQQVELRLRMSILNVCLASVGKRENDLRDARAMLVDVVHDLITSAESAARQTAGQLAMPIDQGSAPTLR